MTHTIDIQIPLTFDKRPPFWRILGPYNGEAFTEDPEDWFVPADPAHEDEQIGQEAGLFMLMKGHGVTRDEALKIRARYIDEQYEGLQREAAERVVYCGSCGGNGCGLCQWKGEIKPATAA